jgi:hypothetical protein
VHCLRAVGEELEAEEGVDEDEDEADELESEARRRHRVRARARTGEREGEVTAKRRQREKSLGKRGLGREGGRVIACCLTRVELWTGEPFHECTQISAQSEDTKKK